jgi:hypothetical protein
MLLCKDSDHSPPWFVDVWRWGLDEEHTRHPPQHAMRTAHFEVCGHVSFSVLGVLIELVFSSAMTKQQANDCAFRLILTKEGPHVLVVRATKDATHFEFYDLPKHMTNPDQIEPEPQIPIACESIARMCHQITLPQPGDALVTGAPECDGPISVVLCAARSARLSELLTYRVCLDRDRELAVRGAAIISDPREYAKTELVLLTLGDAGLELRSLAHPTGKATLPIAVAVDELHGTLAILGDAHSMHILFFDSDLVPAE